MRYREINSMRYLIYLSFFVWLTPAMNAQQVYKTEAEWNGLSFGNFADSLQHHLGLKVFFSSEELVSLKMDTIPAGTDIQSALNDFLESQNLKLYSLSEKSILIIQRELLSLRLPQYYFSTLEGTKELGIALEEEPDSQSEASTKETLQEFTRVVDIGSVSSSGTQTRAVVSGLVRDKNSGEPIVGATVYSIDLQTGTVTNARGMYFLKIPKGSHQIGVRFVGKKEISLTVYVYSDGGLDFEMEDEATELKAVVITSGKYNNIESTQMGVSRIDTRMMGSIPAIGEIDVLKVSTLLPGVQSVGEGTTGFNVRGGNTDQNLILLDQAPIFNPSHLMGFFSAFNAELIRDFEFHKSVVPAKMGGRLSSVMELNLKNGNKKKLQGSAGISPLTGKVSLEGPLIKNKLSYLVGGRSTYSNWLLKRIDNEEINHSEANFRDMNIKLDYDINIKHSISFSGYYSSDEFYKSERDTAYLYTNSSANLSWKYKINPGLIKNTQLIYSNYNNTLQEESNPVSAYSSDYSINYYSLRSDFLYFLNNDHLLNFGIQGNIYSLNPGTLKPANEESLVIPDKVQDEKGAEIAIYLGDEYKLSSSLTINAGLRYAGYASLGPSEIFRYQADLPMDLSTLTDTLFYRNNEISSFNHGLEPRISLRYMPGKNFSFKMGYSRMRQNIHIMSNTFSVSPTDTWKLSDPNLGPQLADQVSAGLYKNLFGGGLETSLEGYYKQMTGLKDYKVAATLLMNHHIETEIIDCEGKAYGLELLLRKPAGKLNGWISYTWSRALQRSNGVYREEKINDNKWFPAIYDKPHSLALVGNYRFSRRISLSSNLVYSTGRPITYPVAKYNFRNGKFLHYSNRNEYRVEDYFRWDMSFNLDGNLRTDQIAHSFWSLSVYNVTGRDNIYSIYFVSGGDGVQGYKMSVFANPIVSLSYNFRF